MHITTKGDTVLQCDKCNRYIRMTTYKRGINFLDVCNITKNCNGTLRPVKSLKIKSTVPSFPPAVEGLDDWYQRRLLYTHEQQIQSTKWIFTHDLGTVPIMRVYIYNEDGELEETEAYVAELTNTTAVITFPVANTGIAQLQALTFTDEDEFAEPTPAPASRYQITNRGELTIATASFAPIYSLTIEYIDSSGQVFSVDYPQIDNVPSILSPWSSADKVLINGKVLKVRSFNLITTPDGDSFFANRQITGMTVKVSADMAETPRNTNVILLSGQPFDSADRDLTKIIDLSIINNIPDGLLLLNGELYRDTNSTIDLYPAKIITI